MPPNEPRSLPPALVHEAEEMRTTTARVPFVSDTIFLRHTYGIQATIDHTHFKDGEKNERMDNSGKLPSGK